MTAATLIMQDHALHVAIRAVAGVSLPFGVAHETFWQLATNGSNHHFHEGGAVAVRQRLRLKCRR